LLLGAVAIIVVFALLIFGSAIRILREYERGVVFTLGRYNTGTKGPGFVLLVPLVQQMVRVDLRVVVDEVPSQDVISRDNVSVKVSAVIYFPGHRCRAGSDPGQNLYGGDQPARADHAAVGIGQA